MSSIKDFELAQRIHVATHELKVRIAALEAENARLQNCESEAVAMQTGLIAALEAEREGLAVVCDERTRIAHVAEAERDALAKDAERINWCEKQWADGIHIEYCAIGIGDIRVIAASTVFLRNKEYKGDSIRAAIDAARSKP